MRKLLLTTILVSALAAPPMLAQTTDPAAPADGTTMPEVMVPEGFSRQDIVLTAEDLLGATIYDAAGNSIGDVHDLVLGTQSGTDGMAPDASAAPVDPSSATEGTAGTAPAGTVTDNPAAGGVAGEAATGDAATKGAAEGAGDMATDGATPDGTAAEGTGDAASGDVTGDGTTGDAATTDPVTEGAGDAATGDTTTAPATGNSATDGAATTDPAMGDSATEGAATEGAGDMATDGAMPGDTTAAATGDIATGAMEPDASAGSTVAITHVVVDIGGFLGMGDHRVALPITDLAIYRSDSETRVYLPWMQEQLEALPAYDEDDPATLGHFSMPVEN